jgi:hypothetical protein
MPDGHGWLRERPLKYRGLLFALMTGLLAEAEEIAADDPDERDRALELLIEFQGRKRDVEAKLRDELDSASCESRSPLRA